MYCIGQTITQNPLTGSYESLFRFVLDPYYLLCNAVNVVFKNRHRSIAQNRYGIDAISFPYVNPSLRAKSVRTGTWVIR